MPYSPTESRRSALALAEEIAVFGFVFALTMTAATAAPQPAAAAASGPQLLWSFFSVFAAVTVLMLVLMRSRWGSRVIPVIFAVAIFSGVGSFFDRLAGLEAAILLTSGLILLFYAFQIVAVFDLILAFGIAGISAALGPHFQPVGLVIIMAVLSVYDIIAVYVTRHMVMMAKELLRQKAFFAMIIPVRPGGWFEKISAAAPEGGFLFLGTGDLVLPALLVAAVSGESPAAPLLVIGGSLLGVAATHVFFAAQPQRRPMPALPPIAAGSIIGYLISLLFNI